MTNQIPPASLGCDEVLALLSDYLDGDLEPNDKSLVEAHLRGCDACTRFGGEVAATLGALRALILEDAPPTDVDALREKLRARLAG